MSLVLLLILFIYGYREMYFHQDDLNWFLLANQPYSKLITAPIGDHVDYIWRILLKLEWDSFNLYFPAYYFISVVIHAIVIWLIYKVAYLTSGRRDLASSAALIFTLNTNWTETVLWFSGQTISITVIFVLLAMIAIWKRQKEILMLFLACMTSALALGLPIAAMLVYGYTKTKKTFKSVRITRVGLGVIISLLSVVAVYYFLSTDGTAIEFGLKWVYHVLIVWGLAMIHTVFGRLIIPFDFFEKVRIFLVVTAMLLGLYKWRDQVLLIWRDAWSRFLILQLWFYYLVVSIGRAQYGIGIMRAERYAYLGLALFLLLFVRILRKWKPGRWIWVVPTLVVLQFFGLYVRAKDYVVKPQKLKALFEQVRQVKPGTIDPNSYLTDFVLSTGERFKYSDLMSLIKD